mgnify:CR=1 FL=1
MSKSWSEEEDKFIKFGLKERWPNKKLISEFHGRFGKNRTYDAIRKRRADFYAEPVDEMVGALIPPTRPIENISVVEVTDDFKKISIAASASIKNPEELFKKSELDPDVKNLVKPFKKTTITLASGRPYVGLTAINTNRQYDL